MEQSCPYDNWNIPSISVLTQLPVHDLITKDIDLLNKKNNQLATSKQ